VKGACPVCGRSAVGTIDHYLPKSLYQEFSFFSCNLVPACDRCNNKRGNSARGSVVGERPIHPYFDSFLQKRVVTVHLEPDWRAPRLLPVPYRVTGDRKVLVQWHI